MFGFIVLVYLVGFFLSWVGVARFYLKKGEGPLGSIYFGFMVGLIWPMALVGVGVYWLANGFKFRR